MNNPIDYEINKELGECYLFMSEFEKAREYYLKAITYDQQNADPFLGLAAVELSLGNIDEAYELYKKANLLTETDKSLAGMAMLEVEAGSHDTAFVNYQKALELNPVNIVALNGLVQLCHYRNDLLRAIDFLEAALAVKNDETVRYTLAACLFSIGRENESREHLEVLLGENPTNQEAQKLYAQFAA